MMLTIESVEYRWVERSGRAVLTGIRPTSPDIDRLSIPEAIAGHPVAAIARWAFDGFTGRIGTLAIPQGLISIDPDALIGGEGNPSIHSFDADPMNPRYFSIGGSLYHADFDPDRTEPALCLDFWGEADGAAYACLPDEVRVIGPSAFRNSAVREVELPGELRKIGDFAFAGCPNLTRITVPCHVKKLGYAVFEGSGLMQAIIEAPIRTIPARLFADCEELESVAFLRSSPRSVGPFAFTHCKKLAGVLGLDKVERFHAYAFSECASLTKMDFSDTLKHIGDQAFASCRNLQSIHIPGSCRRIGWAAFAGCSGITKLMLGEGIEAIEPSAFEGLSALDRVEFPASLTDLGSAFADCTSLKKAVFYGSSTAIAPEAFSVSDGMNRPRIPHPALTVEGIAGSGTEAFAASNGYPFAPIRA